MGKEEIGKRMKENYEMRARNFLTRRTPVIMRLDGKAFHTFTKGMKRPFDEDLNNMMRATAMKLCEEIQGAKCAYVQSDEISILITDYDKTTTDAWFDYNVQKMTSVSASIATATFNRIFGDNADYDESHKLAYFDSRVFNIPREEVSNYFIWRYKDWERNSIQLCGQANYSHSQLHKKSCNQIREMLLEEKDFNWWDLEDKWKNGTFIARNEYGWAMWNKCPDFVKDRSVIENIVNCDKEE